MKRKDVPARSFRLSDKTMEILGIMSNIDRRGQGKELESIIQDTFIERCKSFEPYKSLIQQMGYESVEEYLKNVDNDTRGAVENV